MRTGGFLAVAPLICVLSLVPDGDVSPSAPPAQSVFATRTGSPVVAPPSEPDGPATATDYGDCGPGARREPALQGEVPGADQRNGRSADGYRCNIERIGRNDIGLRGHNFQLAWYRSCAYVSTVGTQATTGALGEPDPSLDGIAVLDAADPRAPQLTDVVKSPVAKSSHEALEVNQRRGLLVTTQGGLVARYIEVYDLKPDCRHPRFLGRYDAGIPLFHGLRVADDGRTVYGTDTFGVTGAGQVMHVVDISDPTRPRRLMTWDPLTGSPPQQYAIHDLDASPDGNRLYLGTASYKAILGVYAGGPSSGDTPSVAIVDASDVQHRRADPKLRVLSTLALPNFGHTVQPLRIAGRPYLLVGGEAPVGGPQACPGAWAHLVEIGDERNPRRVSDLRLEVNRRSNCGQVAQDGSAIYSPHYAGVDSLTDTKLIFYTWYTGGLRIFDVTDPAQPKEVGYYNPPPTPGTKFHAMSPLTPDSPSATLDYTTSVVRYFPATRRLWIVSANSGFQVLQLTGKLAKPRCPRTRFTIRLDRRFARARVTVNGRRASVRRVRRRLTVTIDVPRSTRRYVVVRITGVTRRGRRVVQTRRLRPCKPAVDRHSP